MNVFNILQILFDAIFIFGIMFLFNYSISQTRKKNDDFEVLKSVQATEIKEQLQDLLLTLKQLGNEVSQSIQKEVRIAEEKTDLLQKLIKKIQKESMRIDALKPDVEITRKNKDNNVAFIQLPKGDKKSNSKNIPREMSKDLFKKNQPDSSKDEGSGMHGLSSEIVREVYRLIDEENDLKSISEKTELSLAEIQLILNLRGNRFTTPN